MPILTCKSLKLPQLFTITCSKMAPPETPSDQGSNISCKAIRGSFLDFVDDPFYVPEEDSARYLADGLLVIADGKIRAFGNYADLQAEYGQIPITAYPGKLIVPGFVDTHIHYPQTEMIAAYGEQLLEWLNRYTFPTERKFKDKDYARSIAEIFLDELLQNGTTTALVFAAVFPDSVDAFFEAAERRQLCMIAGKVMMDRNAPDFICDTAESSYQETKSADPEMAQKRSIALCGYPTLCPNLHRGTTAPSRRTSTRISRCVSAYSSV